MAKVIEHLSVSALEQRLKGCTDATAARHVQVIWLLAQGHSSSQVSAKRAIGHDPDGNRAGWTAQAVDGTAARWRSVVEP